jgi:ATP-dependent Clp protease protease subunit
MALALRCPAAASPSPAKSTFPPSSSPPPSRLPRRPPASCRCYYYGDGGGFRKNYDHIPKQFREENLKDGLMDNYKNVPQFLYGLSPAQIEMFMNDDNPYDRQSQRVTEESISASRSYDEFGMYNLSGMHEGPAGYSMGMGMGTMSMGRAGRGYRRMRSSAPDLPSLLLDSRIIFLGMPIVPAVTELIAAQFLWLDYDDRTKPIYLYINSTGTMDENNELVASETDAFAIADFINRSKSKVYTINLSMAYGQAAMLLSLGVKGKRGVLPNSISMLFF